MIKSILVLEDGTEIMAGASQVNAIQSTSIEESCNDGQDLNFGSVCSKKISINIITPQNRLPIKAGEKITLYEEEDGVRRKSGIFNAEKPQKRNSNTTKIEAYDNISLLDKDISEWFNSLDGFPYTSFEMAKIVCEHCGINLANSSIENGDFRINKTELQKVTARQIIRWIGEICGCFCIADEDGSAVYRWYQENKNPIVASRSDVGEIFLRGSLSFEDYETKKIDRIDIKISKDNAVSYPFELEAKNVYIIENNPFFDSNAEQTSLIAEKLYQKIADVSYTPSKVSVLSSFKFNVGDIIKITDANGVSINSYVMSKKRDGQKETLESTGNHQRNGATSLYSTSYSSNYGNNLSVQKDIARIDLGVKDINLRGYVTAESLTKDGTTVIDGSRIQTGQIVSANYSQEYILIVNKRPVLEWISFNDAEYDYCFPISGIYDCVSDYIPSSESILAFNFNQEIDLAANSSYQIKFYKKDFKIELMADDSVIETTYATFGIGKFGFYPDTKAAFSNSGTRFDLEKGSIISDDFSVMSNGYAYFGGYIDVKSAMIGVFDFRGDYIFAEKGSYSMQIAPINTFCRYTQDDEGVKKENAVGFSFGELYIKRMNDVIFAPNYINNAIFIADITCNDPYSRYTIYLDTESETVKAVKTE